MNHKNKPMEFSYYGLYLQNYLRDNHPDKATDTDFITTRADQAANSMSNPDERVQPPKGHRSWRWQPLSRGCTSRPTTPL